MASPPTPTFLHSGKLGDAVYALAPLRGLDAPRLLLREGTDLTAATLAALLPLLRAQPWLAEARRAEPGEEGVDLDAFRIERMYWINLAGIHAAKEA